MHVFLTIGITSFRVQLWRLVIELYKDAEDTYYNDYGKTDPTDQSELPYLSSLVKRPHPSPRMHPRFLWQANSPVGLWIHSRSTMVPLIWNTDQQFHTDWHWPPCDRGNLQISTSTDDSDDEDSWDFRLWLAHPLSPWSPTRKNSIAVFIGKLSDLLGRASCQRYYEMLG